jgi:apolipoprotein D and lipocalin family protein
MTRIKCLFATLAALLIGGCNTAIPDGMQAVEDFELDRYLGRWYEVARLDHSFERGLSDVTAHYSLREDGSVKVVNRGYNSEDDEWEEATGRAKFIGEADVGSLKVSFFGPFYGGYHVVALDQDDYEWSMVVGPDREYLWILARSPTLPDDVLEPLLQKAQDNGFDTDELIWVSHDHSADNSP